MKMRETSTWSSVTRLGKLKAYTENTARLNSVMATLTKPYCRHAVSRVSSDGGEGGAAASGAAPPLVDERSVGPEPF